MCQVPRHASLCTCVASIPHCCSNQSPVTRTHAHTHHTTQLASGTLACVCVSGAATGLVCSAHSMRDMLSSDRGTHSDVRTFTHTHTHTHTDTQIFLWGPQRPELSGRLLAYLEHGLIPQHTLALASCEQLMLTYTHTRTYIHTTLAHASTPLKHAGLIVCPHVWWGDACMYPLICLCLCVCVCVSVHVRTWERVVCCVLSPCHQP